MLFTIALGVTVCTTATTVHVAMPTTLSSNTDGTAFHHDVGAALYVAISRTSIYIVLNDGIAGNNHLGRIDVG